MPAARERRDYTCTPQDASLEVVRKTRGARDMKTVIEPKGARRPGTSYRLEVRRLAISP
jgi:hypothetical protein